MTVDLSENKKLIWMGLKRPSTSTSIVEKEVRILKENIGDFSDFQSDLDDEGIASFSDFKSYLTSTAGFTSNKADAFVSKIKNSFEDTDSSGSAYDEFEDYVENDASTWEEFKIAFESVNQFGSTTRTEDGESAAGIRFFDNDGVTRDGINVPAGSTEIYGKQIHFSSTADPRTTASDFTYANLRSDDDDNVVNSYVTVTISADVTNPNAYSLNATVTLTEDGEPMQTKNVFFTANETKTTSFEVQKTEYVCHDYAIGDLSPITICWVPSGLII